MDNNGQKNPILKFLLYDVEFLGGVLIALLIFAGIFIGLNYLNIISLPSIYKPLSFLPHQSVKQPPIPTPSNYTPAPFQYDTEKAKKLLTQYIKDTIKPSLLPSQIEVKQGLSIDGRTEDIKYEFGSMFISSNSSVSANFHYKEGSNTPNDFEIFIQPENITQATATASLANSLLAAYFVNPYSISKCTTKGANSSCENLQVTTEGKRGYGILLINNSSKLTSIIFNCFVPKESKNFEKMESCVTF